MGVILAASVLQTGVVEVHVLLQQVNLCMSFSELEFRFRLGMVLSVVDVSSLSV